MLARWVEGQSLRRKSDHRGGTFFNFSSFFQVFFFSITSPTSDKSKHEEHARNWARACVPLDQRLVCTTTLGDSKTGTRNFWFHFGYAYALEILHEMNKFSTANQIWLSCWRVYSRAQRSRFLVQTRRIAASGDDIGRKDFWLRQQG